MRKHFTPWRALVLVVVAMGAIAAGALPVLADGGSSNPDFRKAQLFRDGSISCTGADDTSHPGGRVLALAQPGIVFFTVKLRNASPNSSYTLAVSQEPNCASPQFYPPVTTDGDGDANVYGSYSTTSGSHNLLFDLSTTTPNTPINREIGTRNFFIRVP